MSLMPDIQSRTYNRSIIYDIIQRNPFAGLTIAGACGIVNY